MKAKEFDLEGFDRGIGVIQSVLEHRRAVPTTRSDELYYELVVNHLLEVKSAIKDGRPIIGYVPPAPIHEIVHGFDGVVAYMRPLIKTVLMKSGDVQDVLQAAKQYGISSDVCGGHRAMIGNALLGWEPRPTAFVWSNLVCDALAKSNEVNQHIFDCEGYLLDRGYGFTEAELVHFTHELEDLVRFLEKVTGQKMNWDKLKEGTDNAEKVVELEAEITELRKAVPSPLKSRAGIMMHLVKMFAMDKPEGVEYFTALRDEAKDLVAQHRSLAKEKYRIVTYFEVPVWGWSLLDWMERVHGAHVVVEPCLSGYYGDMKKSGNGPLETLAWKTFIQPGCWQWNGPVDYAVRDVVRAAKEFKADGVLTFSNICCVHSCCSNEMVKEGVLEEVGIPFCTVDCDIADPTVVPEQEIKEKMETFFEMLDERR